MNPKIGDRMVTIGQDSQNANAIFTSENLDKSGELADTLNYLIINDAKYYVSNSVTANEAKVDFAKRSEDKYSH